MKLLVKRHEGHIKDYGFISDLMGETRYYGLSHEFVDLMYEQGHTISHEFIPNPDIPPHTVFDRDIPKGTLSVYVELNPRYNNV